MSDPIKFASADERIAWDRYVSGIISDPEVADYAAAACGADRLLQERRKREPTEFRMDLALSADGRSIADNMERIANALHGHKDGT